MSIYVLSLENAVVHITKGNTKIGQTIYSFSTLPGNQDYLITAKGKLLTDIPGTCSHNCQGCFSSCYAVKSARQHHNAVIPAWGENTLLLRFKPVELFNTIDEYITEKNSKFYKTKAEDDLRVGTWRWNVSGEIQNLNELELMDKLAGKHPEVQFGIYTKNFEVLEQFFDKYNDTQPNFVINVSQWHHVADEIIEKLKGKVNIFEYDDSNLKDNELSEEDIARLKKLAHCPAVTKKGKRFIKPDGEAMTCDKCRRCYTKTGDKTAVYAH